MPLPYSARKGAKSSMTGALLGLLLVLSTALGEQAQYNVSQTVCRGQVLELKCSEDAVVTATIYGGHHMDDDGTNCSYVSGDCVASIKGGHTDSVDQCLWKNSICQIELTNIAYFEEPCMAYSASIHYIAAVDFICVSKNDVYSVSEHGTNTNTTSGYIISPGYPTVYPREGRRYRVTVEGRFGLGVSLRTVHMNVRPEVDGACADYVEVKCSVGGWNVTHCGSDAWSVPPERCSADVIITLVTSNHVRSYKGFLIAFNYVEITKAPTTAVTSEAWTFIPGPTLTVASLSVVHLVTQLH